MTKTSSSDRSFWLEPESGVQTIDGRWQAVSLPFWLRLEPVEIATRHRWIRLRYSSSFFDEPIRPLIRFVTSNGKTFTQLMNGTVLGSAEWIGRVPDHTVSVSISPGRQLGPFSFRIERMDTVSRFELLWRAWLNDPSRTLWALRARLLDSREEAWQALKYAVGGTPFKSYSKWRTRLSRALDISSFDRPRMDWTVTPAIHLLMSLDRGDGDGLRTTIKSLQAQAYRRWSLHAAVTDRTSADVLAAFRYEMRNDGRLFELSQAHDPVSHANNPIPPAWSAVIEAGDSLQTYALAVVAERLAAEPRLSVLYCDEDAIARSGMHHSPILKPDWSPVFHNAVSYLGRLTCVRHADLAAQGADATSLLSDEKAVLDGVLAGAERQAVGHVRRVLYSRRSNEPRESPGLHSIQGTGAAEPHWPAVAVVIPTRDRADLLETCLRGLKEMTDYPSFGVVIVDNGSSEPKALEILAALRTDRRFTILERPGPFNFSKLANEGAQFTNAPLLAFLNNDIEILHAGWLKSLVRWAMQPNVGVVGAKLLFPNGTIQHAGVALGLGGIAGHIYGHSRPDDPGYLHQLDAVRETTAVTAACIAIEKKKFDAVGGFDASNLPVDLNDMDLCLRVAEHGWTNIWTPESALIHVQSASRGTISDSFDTYRQERDYFTKRWVEAIRDDPYFHPGFDLFSQQPRLG